MWLRGFYGLAVVNGSLFGTAVTTILPPRPHSATEDAQRLLGSSGRLSKWIEVSCPTLHQLYTILMKALSQPYIDRDVLGGLSKSTKHPSNNLRARGQSSPVDLERTPPALCQLESTGQLHWKKLQNPLPNSQEMSSECRS